MMENRSFDHIAGLLYAPGNPPPFDRPPRNQPFDGAFGRHLGNPVAGGGGRAPEGWVPFAAAPFSAVPRVAPSEGYAPYNLQIYGAAHPPYNVPPDAPLRPPMSGFVVDYLSRLAAVGRLAERSLYRQVMDGFTPAQLPVTSALAAAYAVCDRWFCSAPAETWPNRSFALAGTSSGFVSNPPYLKWRRARAATVFDRIDAEAPRLSWRVYSDWRNILPLTWMMFPSLTGKLWTHFRPIGAFERAAAAGRLPSLSWIEPNMLWLGRNDQRPPGSMLPGERLIRRVYRAVRSSPCWDRSLLIVTYDEHGGLFDHVPPPPAIPPELGAPPGEDGFRFDRLGPRVCTLLVSPWIEPGTVFRPHDARGEETHADHTSLIRTVCARFGLPPLTRRDAGAADLSDVLTLDAPRGDVPGIPPP